jgi:hypothetical protein
MNPKLAIVIHTEEEFNWDNGFYRSNNKVTHGKQLITFCEKLINIGAKITFAIDYAFVDSDDGKKVITHFKQNKFNGLIEFGTHLHPWVNPPFSNKNDKITNRESYPGNLPKELEFQKLKALTDKITEVCGVQPTTYLAGRYGVGKRTNEILKELGYKTNISISPFSDFSHQEGPDFSQLNNNVFERDGITHWPHTTAILSLFSSVTKWFNNHPEKFEQLQKNSITRLLMKILRVKRQRLSPEGFTLKDLQKITETQLALGQQNFLFSFHSPSVQKGLTPYVKTQKQADQFLKATCTYLNWFKTTQQGEYTLIKNIPVEH